MPDPAVLLHVLDPAVLVLDRAVLVLHPEDTNLFVFMEMMKIAISQVD